MMSSRVLAAGAIVWRRNDSDELEVALIHRPKYDDWSFPKGKLEENEIAIACAFREVMEETGFSIVMGPYIGELNYLTHGINKNVQYWSARFISAIGQPQPSEVDVVKWFSISEAEVKLSRPDDISILKTFMNFDLDTNVLVLLRHTKALDRNEWIGDDGDRPLIQLGQLQAKRLLSTMQVYGIEEIHSSAAVRCYETVTPIARSLNLNLIFAEDLSEYVYAKNPDKPLKYIRKLLNLHSNVIACSHNPILPEIMANLVEKSGVETTNTKLEPGDAWIVHHVDNVVISIDFLAAPAV